MPDPSLISGPACFLYVTRIDAYDMEMQNGGLCQFLMNAGRFHGAVLEEALLAFGAERHAGLVSDFCKENKIDISNPQQFVPVSVEHYVRLYQEYPFEAFDQAYFALVQVCPLERMLGEYIRKHPSEFLGTEMYL